jgi:hypothetical protein
MLIAARASKARESLLTCMKDVSPSIRIAAPEALKKYGWDKDADVALKLLIGLADSLEKSNSYAAIHALNAIDAIGKRAAPFKAQIAGLPTQIRSHRRVNEEYTTKMLTWLKGSL